MSMSRQKPLPEECFRICNDVTSINKDKIPVSSIPHKGDVVYTESNVEIRIKDELGHGGEGYVYYTNSPFLAKIYKAENITNRIKNKIELMLQKRIECDGICYPVAALYNRQKEFVGYLMPLAKGKELQHCVFMPMLLSTKIPYRNWKKIDLVKLSITILKKIEYLHDRNIIIGDINPNNILVVSPEEVYFVDTDSFQVEDYPCPVGTVNFTAPEIHEFLQKEKEKGFGDFLRTKGNENFAVATLLFMLMLPGKPPYAQQGGEDPVSNIKRMDFSYPYQGESNKKTPEGPWRYMWSHLPPYIKEDFYKTFRKDEDYSLETYRLSVSDWIFEFEKYYNDYENLVEFDKMSEEIFPERLKKYTTEDKIGYCENCGREILMEKSDFGYCYNCYHTKTIGPSICKDCGKEFYLSRRDYKYYIDKEWNLPKRCEKCRHNKTHY